WGSRAASSASASSGAEGADRAAWVGAAWSVITVHPARAVRRVAGGCGRRVPHTTAARAAPRSAEGSACAEVAEPVVDEGAPHRGRARQRDLRRLERGGERVAGEPAGLDE